MSMTPFKCDHLVSQMLAHRYSQEQQMCLLSSAAETNHCHISYNTSCLILDRGAAVSNVSLGCCT